MHGEAKHLSTTKWINRSLATSMAENQEFLPEGHVKTNFLCNLWYGDPNGLHPRLPRLPFNEACSLL